MHAFHRWRYFTYLDSPFPKSDQAGEPFKAREAVRKFECDESSLVKRVAVAEGLEQRTTAALRDSQLKLHTYLSSHKQVRPSKARRAGRRGIVITAGGQRLLINAVVVAKVIREKLNSSLPIEVFYYGQEEYDAQLINSLEAVPGVTVLDGNLSPRPKQFNPWPDDLHPYAKKVFSLYSSSFEEVLLLDSDSQPLRQPEALFALPGYRSSGNAFWRDYWTAKSAREAPTEEVYNLLRLEVPWTRREDWASTESGQLLFNKKIHAKSLAWILWINLWADIIYTMALGDKDTFEMGFMLSGRHNAFHQLPDPPRAAFTEANKDGWHRHVGMVHSIQGMPAFLHRVSGGKFDGSKEAGQQLRATYITELMSVPMAKQYTWHTKWAINTLADYKTELKLDCKNLQPVTVKALQRVLKSGNYSESAAEDLSRLSECDHAMGRVSRIPLIPIELFGQSVESGINFGYETFKALKAA